jgi:alginate O-acetyltransferase complex protein AlgI
VPTIDEAQECVKRLIRGLFKKLVLVTWLQTGVDALLQQGNHFYVSFAMALICYALLYADLSGYSDIAIAVGTFLGVPTPENFKQPLQSATFTQFWRKWHVTLSDWIREHIFVVVNGKRLNKYLSALIGMGTMLIMAAWHGFNRVEMLCGVYLGMFLALENIFGQTTVNRRRTNKWLYAFRSSGSTLCALFWMCPRCMRCWEDSLSCETIKKCEKNTVFSRSALRFPCAEYAAQLFCAALYSLQWSLFTQ